MSRGAFWNSSATVLVWVFFSACTSEGTTSGGDRTGDSGLGNSHDLPDASGPHALNGPCAASDRIGGFEIVHEESYSYVSGEIADGILPSAVPIELSSVGSCRMLQKNNPYCNPPCSAGQTCDNDGACIPFPANQNAGTVSVQGLLDPVVMEPTEGGNLYFETSLPHPAFEPGSPIGLTAAGADVPGFSLHAEGVAPLETPGEGWFIAPGQELVVTWTPDPAHAADIVAMLTIDQHGTSPASIVCEVPDRGSLTVPVELTDALLDLGVSGFPNGTLTRRTADSVAIGLGCIELVVFSQVLVDVGVESHTPCMSNADCPEGQTCDFSTSTCVAAQ